MKLTNEQILDSLGLLTPVGETNTDNKVFNNLQQAIELVDYIVDELLEASQNKDRAEYSMSMVGKKSASYLEHLADRLSQD